MSIILNDSLQINAPKAVDAKYMKFLGGITQPYASSAEALSLIPLAYRYQYLTVLCMTNGDAIEYWWVGGTADANIQPKSKDSYLFSVPNNVSLFSGYLYTNIVILPANNITNLIIGTTSGGTDIEPGVDLTAGSSYSASIGIYVNAVTNLYFGNLSANTKILLYKTR